MGFTIQRIKLLFLCSVFESHQHSKTGLFNVFYYKTKTTKKPSKPLQKQHFINIAEASNHCNILERTLTWSRSYTLVSSKMISLCLVIFHGQKFQKSKHVILFNASNYK